MPHLEPQKMVLPFWVQALLVVLGHLLYFATGNGPIDISYSWQLATAASMAHNHTEALVYLHLNPPGLSILYYYIQRPFPWGPYGFAACMVGLQIASLYLFQKASARTFSAAWRPYVVLVLFLNPMVVAYFQYPFYCTYLFVLSCLFLYLFTLPYADAKGWAAGALLLGGILRNLFAMPYGALLALPLFLQQRTRRNFIILAICALPTLAIAIKNKVYFNVFGPSTWTGINLANGGYVSYKNGAYPELNRPFIFDARPAAYVDTVLEKRFSGIMALHGQDFNNLNTVYLSRYYAAEAKRQFTLAKFARIAGLGGLQYLESPLEYPLLHPFKGGPKTGIVNESYPFDFFNLPNVARPVLGGTLIIPFSLYTFIYPAAFLMGLWLLVKRKQTALLPVLWIVFFVTGVYSTIDPSESNRMRMEIEPLWWWLVLAAGQYLWPGNKQVA